MTSSTLTDLVLGLALIVYISSRLLRWRPIDPARMLKLPLLLSAAGVVLMARQTTTVKPVDIVILGWLGVAIWFGLVVIRVGLDVAGHRMGSDLGVSTGVILLVLGVNRLTAALVISARHHRHPLAMAGK
jgi:hypothetical protein